MKTKELARLLAPLHPCTEGLKDLLRHNTVAQWWRKCRNQDHLWYVWTFVATADSDDTFARELEKWEDFWGRPDGSHIRVCRRHWSPATDTEPATSKTNFRRVFRCPTDAELRMAGRYFAEKETR